MRLLVVEDDPDHSEFLRSLLGRINVNVALEAVFLKRMQDALRVVERVDIDIVLSDFVLPDGTSAELFERVRERLPRAERILLAKTPFITGYAHADARVWSKDESISETRARIEDVLQVRALMQATRGGWVGPAEP